MTVAILNSFVNDTIPKHIGIPSLYFFITGLTLATVLRQVHPNKGISNEAIAVDEWHQTKQGGTEQVEWAKAIYWQDPWHLQKTHKTSQSP